MANNAIDESQNRWVKQARILVVDDVGMTRKLLKTTLEKDGYEVDIATNGAEAVEAAKAVPYDLVLMDVQMPVMDGIEATKTIRSLRGAGCEVPIIAVTAADRVVEMATAGIDDYHRKGSDPEILIRLVRKWVGAGPMHR